MEDSLAPTRLHESIKVSSSKCGSNARAAIPVKIIPTSGPSSRRRRTRGAPENALVTHKRLQTESRSRLGSVQRWSACLLALEALSTNPAAPQLETCNSAKAMISCPPKDHSERRAVAEGADLLELAA